jgi:cbb3-type cytochrome oxidase cytochrome c subunit
MTHDPITEDLYKRAAWIDNEVRNVKLRKAALLAEVAEIDAYIAHLGVQKHSIAEQIGNPNAEVVEFPNPFGDGSQELAS